MSGSVRERYEARVAAGMIERDEAQQALLRRLDGLVQALADHRLKRKGSALGWLFAKRPGEPPKGLYIFGEVGRGKTMLMELFFEAAPVRRKRRVHFHAFMQDVHARIHRYRQTKDGDPIPAVAAEIAEEAWLLAFDEFQVTDIADAMILGRLFQGLFEAGVVVIATSNRPPKDLYKDGLNRALFLPFIAMLEQRLNVVRLDSRTDFRLEKFAGMPVWHVPADAAAKAALDKAFDQLSGGERAKPETLTVQGRALLVPQSTADVARFSFDALCRAPLGPGDYLAIAERYDNLIVDGIPRLKAEERNETRRLVLLIDALYDFRTKLIASADAEPSELLEGGDHAFEFERTASRLFEMRSEQWLALPHGREDHPRDPDTGGIVET